MLASVRALMSGIIDYAGLFPPAGLELPAAVGEFTSHTKGDDAWMLARFVIAAGRLDELSALLEDLPDPPTPLRLSVLGRGGVTRARFTAGLADDLAVLERFQTSHGDQVEIDQLELRLPEAPGEIPFAVAEALELLGDHPDVVPFLEVSLLEGWRGRIQRAIGALSSVAGAGRKAGLKIRCGGADASAVPSPVAVTAALAASRRTGIPLKATQGLHHPVRRFDSTLETTIHGFFNLFVAGVLGRAHSLTEERVLDIVVDEDPGSFRFSNTALRWRDLAAEVDDVVAARQTTVTSFGSCSFTEPRDDLRQLGLLDEPTPS